ncbi:MAG: 4Fe-4S dicluster domain-containing protein [Spirochaetales bacterium]|nr:4Fe-4S dicluster domain-containing protein [Spirochaetales bacterium]
MDNEEKIDVLVTGAGPAGLSSALRLKRHYDREGIQKNILVIDSAKSAGYHSLSGGLVKQGFLTALSDNLPQSIGAEQVRHDSLAFLSPCGKTALPAALLPPEQRHFGDVILSISRLCKSLAALCEKEGIDVLYGVTAGDLIVERGKVHGIVIPEQGINKDGTKKYGFKPSEKLYADVTLIADGSLGTLSSRLKERFGLLPHAHQQTYSIGIKKLFRTNGPNPFGAGRVIHTLGYPLPPDVFGGGFLYSADGKAISAGLVVSLGWKYRDLDPQEEFERFLRHPAIEGYLLNTELAEAGAKTVPCGGYGALTAPGVPGALLLGDAAGFVNTSIIKGLHCAIASGFAAADSVFQVEAGYNTDIVRSYERELYKKGVLPELFRARNFRQLFTTPLGLYAGLPLTFLMRAIPGILPMKRDAVKTRALRRKLRFGKTHKADKDLFVHYSGTIHDETSISHINIKDAGQCIVCGIREKNPCVSFCPGGVYSLIDGGLHVQSVNCIHDKACKVKCPYDNIEWNEPEGGYGPSYREM